VIDRRNSTTSSIELFVETNGDPTNPALLLVMGLSAQMYLWPDGLVDQLVDSTIVTWG
jgi:hypothetical protein